MDQVVGDTLDTGGVRVGTAGGSYPDWEGVVYPRGAARTGEALRLLARLLDVLEINVSFYRPPSVRMARSWLASVAPFPTFVFTAKLWQGFTHQRDEAHPAEELAYREGIEPLLEAGRARGAVGPVPPRLLTTPPAPAPPPPALGSVRPRAP